MPRKLNHVKRPSDREEFDPTGTPDVMLPEYDSFCLSNVSPTVLSLFGVDAGRPKLPKKAFGDVEVDSIEHIVLLVLDGLGYGEWCNQSNEGFIGAMTHRGHVRPITTVFPSTTAAGLTSLSTGLTPQEHGLPEWFVYFRELDMIIATLPFTPMGDIGRDTLNSVADPRMLFTGEPVYKKLKRSGVPTIAFVNRQIAGSAYSSTSLRGSITIPYVSSSDLVANLKRKIEEAKSSTLFYVYWSFIDTIEHRFGPNTDESTLEASTISFAMKKGLVDRLDRRVARKTLLLATADHGQVDVSRDRTLYLNRHRKVVTSFERGENGLPILPSGSARDVFLHIRHEKLDEMYEYLRESLAEKAEVMKTEDAIRQGFFGINSPCENFRDRVGNILLLPRGKKTIWYHHTRNTSFEMRGHHGGLTREEMTIPFASARISELQSSS